MIRVKKTGLLPAKMNGNAKIAIKHPGGEKKRRYRKVPVSNTRDEKKHILKAKPAVLKFFI